MFPRLRAVGPIGALPLTGVRLQKGPSRVDDSKARLQGLRRGLNGELYMCFMPQGETSIN